MNWLSECCNCYWIEETEDFSEDVPIGMCAGCKEWSDFYDEEKEE